MPLKTSYQPLDILKLADLSKTLRGASYGVGLLLLVLLAVESVATFFPHMLPHYMLAALISNILLVAGFGALFILGHKLYRNTKDSLDLTQTTIDYIMEGGRDIYQIDEFVPQNLEQRHLMLMLQRLMIHVSQTEENLRAQAQAAKLAADSKREFLSVMSHEIRTPLNGMLGMAGLLKDTGMNTEQRGYLNVVRDSGENLLMVINDILDFSKLEAGKMGLEMTDFELCKLVESVSELLAPAAHAKGVEVSSYISPNVPHYLRGDVARIRQILTNLVSNAIKFTKHGAVMVEVLQESRGDKTVKLVFQVSDTGIGMNSDMLPHLFDRFTQADSGISRKFGGTGLGLAISKQLVEMMGGDISASSEFGEGSTFKFIMPLQVVTDALITEDKLDATVLKNKRVLVVDDHNFNRYSFKKQMEAWEMDVDTAEDGPDALVKLNIASKAGKAFDVMVLDHLMPNMDGEDVLAHVQEHSEFSQLKVLLASSQNISGTDPYFKNLGFDAILTKPVREHTLQRYMIKAIQNDVEMVEEEMVILPKNLRILVVEDNHINQLYVQKVLQNDCKVIDIAANGIEALRMAQSMPYDVILMDLNMPEMDGIEATREIRKLRTSYGATPIIALTADVSAEKLEACYAVGMQDVIHKPADVMDIKRAILRAFHTESPATHTELEQDISNAEQVVNG